MSQSLLTRRLDELEYAGIVTRKALAAGGHEYGLTEAGEALRPIVELMGLWGNEFLMHQLSEDELDPNLLFWDMRRNVDAAYFPKDSQYVVHFEISGVKKAERRWWLIHNDVETDICCRDPGFAVDLEVFAPIRSLVEAWVGIKELKELIRTGKIRLEGDSKNKSVFTKWFLLSPFANDETKKRLSIGNMAM